MPRVVHSVDKEGQNCREKGGRDFNITEDYYYAG
jgi:hypothetical protein